MIPSDLLESFAPQFIAHRDAQVGCGSQGGELCGENGKFDWSPASECGIYLCTALGQPSPRKYVAKAGMESTYLHQKQQPLDDESDGHVVRGMRLHGLQAAPGEEAVLAPLLILVAAQGYTPSHQDVVMGAQLAAAGVLGRNEIGRDDPQIAIY